MSMESAVAFYERVETDLELQEKLKKLNTKESISQYVKGELGYDFTAEEMQKVIFEGNPDISEEELEAVVGGMRNDEALTLGLVIAGGLAVGTAAGIVVGGVIAFPVLAAVAA